MKSIHIKACIKLLNHFREIKTTLGWEIWKALHCALHPILKNLNNIEIVTKNPTESSWHTYMYYVNKT